MGRTGDIQVQALTNKLTEKITLFAYEIEPETKRLVNGRNYSVDRGQTSVEGKSILPKGYSHAKQWQLTDDGELQEYVPPPNSVEAKEQLKSIELARLSAGREATAEIAVAMKGDGAALQALSDEQFEGLNTAGEPVSSALLKGQFQTALKRWRSIFADPTTAPFEYSALITAFIATPVFTALDAAVVAIIKAKIKEFDELTDEQIEQL